MFLQDLENAAGETLDYSRMNRDLSQSATTMSPEGAAKAAATLAALEDIEQEEEGSIVPPTKSEPITDQVSYSTSLAIGSEPIKKQLLCLTMEVSVESCESLGLNFLHVSV